MKRSMLVFGALLLAMHGIGCHHHTIPEQGDNDAGTGGAIDVNFPAPDGGPGVPLLPTLTNVQATADDDRVAVTFEPVPDAGDYRIYPLPTADQVTVGTDGSITIKNATYRCAGDREAWPVGVEVDPDWSPNQWVTTRVNSQVQGYARTTADATLGYAFSTAASDRVAVYAVGDPDPNADNSCSLTGGNLWGASRVKKYVLQAEHDSLVAQGWRDDGVAFYAPMSGAVVVNAIIASGGTNLYFASPGEISARASSGAVAAPFSLLPSASSGAEPVMRVYYENGCGNSHDELMLGVARYQRALTQGPQPIFALNWSGNITDTTYVVEALDQGCPFPGELSFNDVPASGNAQTFLSLTTAHSQSPTGEIYVNGQHEPTNKPRAVARSFVKLSPVPRAAMDVFDGFASDPGFTVTSVANHGYQDVYLSSTKYDAQFYSTEPTMFSIGSALGELWVSYADWASDSPGKFRMTLKQKPLLSSSAYLHVTTMVDLYSTNRRYPQILISDQPSPVQENLAQGTTLILQAFYGWPSVLQLQVCDHRTWDVNNQCPTYHLTRTAFTSEPWAPFSWVGENAAPAWLKQLDLYVSTQRAYVLLDGKPYGCANLSDAPPAGPVSVSIGDTLYHSGVDEVITAGGTGYVFQATYQLTETRRQFDSLGYSAGVGAPSWNETALPCTSVIDGQ